MGSDLFGIFGKALLSSTKVQILTQKLCPAGMGSDLFGSFGEASCAALLIGVSCESIEAAGTDFLAALLVQKYVLY